MSALLKYNFIKMCIEKHWENKILAWIAINSMHRALVLKAILNAGRRNEWANRVNLYHSSVIKLNSITLSIVNKSCWNWIGIFIGFNYNIVQDFKSMSGTYISWVIVATDRQTDKQTHGKCCIPYTNWCPELNRISSLSQFQFCNHNWK